MKDIPVKVNGNTVSADEYNSATQEEKNIVTDTGQTLNEADNFQVSKAASNYAASGDFYTDSGSAVAYILAAQGSKQSPTAYVDGFRARFIPANTNTGIATVNIGGLGVKALKTYTNHDLVGGELQAGFTANLTYDGTNFRLSTHHQSAVINGTFIDKLTMSNNAGDPNRDIDLTVGSCSDSGNSVIMVNRTAGFSKRLDAVWAEGNGNGGRASAVSLSPKIWYHYFGISKVDGTFDAGFDTSINATNLLADASAYTFYRYLGSVLTDGSSDIEAFINFQNTHGRFFYWKSLLRDVGINNPGTAARLETVRVPIDINIMAIVNPGLVQFASVTTSVAGFYVSSPLVSNQAPSTIGSGYVVIISGQNWQGCQNQMHVLTNESAQLRFRADYSSTDIDMICITIGWIM